MSWIKYTFLTFLVILICFAAILISDFVAKKYLGLGQPIVYDSHPLWGYSPRANRQYSRLDGATVTINNIGTRGSESWNADENNIVFFGDSVTYGGSYLNDDQTFVSISCVEIANWHCHNAGVNAYGILNMIARSRYDERINKTPIRVFTFVSGDFDRGLQNSNTAHFILRDPPKQLSGLWEILNFLASSVTPKVWFGKQSDILDQSFLNQAQLVSRQFVLDILITELERLDGLGLKFLLVHSPTINELQDRDLITNNQVLNDLKLQFPHRLLSLHTVLKEEYENSSEKIYKDTVHYQVRGHQIVGDYLHPFIINILNKYSKKHKMNN